MVANLIMLVERILWIDDGSVEFEFTLDVAPSDYNLTNDFNGNEIVDQYLGCNNYSNQSEIKFRTELAIIESSVRVQWIVKNECGDIDNCYII